MMKRRSTVPHNPRRRRHYCHFRNACCLQLLTLLLAVFLSREQGVTVVLSQSLKQSEIDRCSEETEALYSNSFALAQQVSELAIWADVQRLTPEAVCTDQGNKKKTCNLDFVNATGNDSSDWCLKLPNTIYVETNFIYKCTNSRDKRMIFYSIRNRPACYSHYGASDVDADADSTISACYNGYDNQIIESIELKTFDELVNKLSSSKYDSGDEWGDVGDGFDSCDRLRFIVTEPQTGVDDSSISCAEATSQIQSSPTMTDAVAELESQLGIVVPNNSIRHLQQHFSRSLMPFPSDGSAIDYGQDPHNISKICKETMNGIYLEVSYAVSCNTIDTTTENGSDSDAISFKVLSDPLCLSKTVCGKNDFESQSIFHATSKWNKSSSSNCQIFTTTSSDNDENESSSDTTNIQAAVTWDDFSPSQSPTLTVSPTLSSAPSMQPTNTPHPTTSMVPSESPTGLSCEDESLNLLAAVSNQDENEDQDETNETKIAKELTQIQNLMMGGNNDNSEEFAKHCSDINAEANGNADAYCEFNYQDVMKTTDTENSIASLCRSANTVYVEDSISIICTSKENEDSSPITTKLEVRNKPSCRSKKCNADSVRELATFEFQRWIKLTLEKGIDESSSSSILAGRQSCVIGEQDEEGQGGVSVSLGGTSTGSDDNDPIEPTDQCLKGTGFMKSLIGVYKQTILSEREFFNYLDTDLRQICGSPKPNVLECNFDWSKLFPSSEATIKSNCMPDAFGSSAAAAISENSSAGCDGGGGQYVESSFRMSCVNVDFEVTMTSKNVPECIGKPCSPDQTQYLLAEKYSLLSNQFMEEFVRFGWSCTDELLSVYAAHFDPLHGTNDIECYKNLQFKEIVAEDVVFEDTIAELNSDLNNNSPTAYDDVEEESPTGTPVALIGPKYGLLFVPVPEPTDAPVEISSTACTALFAGTIIILILQTLLSVVI